MYSRPALRSLQFALQLHDPEFIGAQECRLYFFTEQKENNGAFVVIIAPTPP